MKKDIVPGLINEISEDIERQRATSTFLKSCEGRLTKGVATHLDTNLYGQEMGKILSSCLKEKVTAEILPDGKMYFNIADRVFNFTLKSGHKAIINYAVDVQTLLNRNAGIGIKGIPIEPDDERIQGLVKKASEAENYGDVENLILDSVENYGASMVDEFIRFNADFHQRSGLEPVIERRTSGDCCEWCSKLAGIYRYKEVKDTGNPVFRRHRNCNCLVIYDPNNGKKGSNIHTHTEVDVRDMEKVHAQILADKTDRTRIQELERYTGIAGNIVRRPRILGAFEPDTLKEMFEESGYEVKPLGKGRLKGVVYENGGGYRINFGGDGFIQYHPKKFSHHSDEYYKISTGPTRTKHYFIEGKLFEEGQ